METHISSPPLDLARSKPVEGLEGFKSEGWLGAMIDLVDGELVSWAEEVTGAPVSLAPPVDLKPDARVSLYLAELRRTAPGRTGGRNPLDLELGYLVTTSDEDPQAAHALLGRLLESAALVDHYHVELVPPGWSCWTALGVAPRPCFLLRVALQHDLPTPDVDLTKELALHVSPLRSLEGLVLGPDARPVRGARVTLGGRLPVVRTEQDGRFAIRVPADSTRALALHVAVRGWERILPIAPGEMSSPFVVRFDLEE